MSYYSTNAEIAREFKVSKTTVTRWLESAIDGKNNLQINQSDKKVQVYKNEHNFAELLKLKEEGVKYKTSTSYKEVSPKKEFYEIFNYKEQVELVNLLSTKKVIPLKYSYFGEGADMWNQSYENSLNQSTYPVVKNTEELLAISYSTILKKISKFKSINIVDVGPGNGFPLKTLITRLLIDGVTIKNYVAVDISNRMLDIVEKNVRSWFDKKIDFRRYKKDIEHDTLFDLLFENKDQNTLNL
ncbi:MAG: class I SAM-dependent methyltransferase, partial [Patescibacteria group bacterium]